MEVVARRLVLDLQGVGAGRDALRVLAVLADLDREARTCFALELHRGCASGHGLLGRRLLSRRGALGGVVVVAPAGHGAEGERCARQQHRDDQSFGHASHYTSWWRSVCARRAPRRNPAITSCAEAEMPPGR